MNIVDTQETIRAARGRWLAAVSAVFAALSAAAAPAQAPMGSMDRGGGSTPRRRKRRAGNDRRGGPGGARVPGQRSAGSTGSRHRAPAAAANPPGNGVALWKPARVWLDGLRGRRLRGGLFRRRLAAPHAVAALLAAALLAGAAGIVSPASAQTPGTLVSNTGQTTTTESDDFQAQSFTTGANTGGYTISEVQISVRAPAGASTRVRIRENNADNRPGNLVATLENPTSFQTILVSLETFAAPANTELEASTTYWITVNEGITARASFGLTASDGQTGETGWSIGNRLLHRLSETVTWGSRLESLVLDIKGSAKANTAPTASDNTVTTTEDTDYTFAASDFNFSDTDLGHSLASVKITTLPGSGKGRLELDGTAIASSDLPQTVTRAQLDDGDLVYDPPSSGKGDNYASFMFKVNDGAADSASAYTMTIDVINTAPTASNSTVTTTVDTDYTFAASDFNFSDTDSGDTLASVKITTLPGSGRGRLELDGTAIGSSDLPQTVTRAQLDDGDLVYDPPSSGGGDGYASFMFRVNDGIADSASAYTMTIDVTAAPLAGLGLVSNIGETRDASTSAHFQAQSFETGSNAGGYTVSGVQIRMFINISGASTSVRIRENDADNEPGDLVATLANPTSLNTTSFLHTFTAPANTVLEANTTYWISVNEGVATRAVLDRTLSDNETGQAGWSIGNGRLWRNSESADWSTSNASLILRIGGSAKAAPTASNNTVTTREDTDYTFTASDFNFSDADPGDTLASVKITTLPGSGKGSLELDGTAIASSDLPQTVTRAQLDDGDLVYDPPSSGSGESFASFAFKVNDGAVDSVSAYTMTIHVTGLGQQWWYGRFVAKEFEHNPNSDYSACGPVGAVGWVGYTPGSGPDGVNAPNCFYRNHEYIDPEYVPIGSRRPFIKAIYVEARDGGTLTFQFRDLPENTLDGISLGLILNGQTYHFDDAEQSMGGRRFVWTNTGLSWRDRQLISFNFSIATVVNLPPSFYFQTGLRCDLFESMGPGRRVCTGWGAEVMEPNGDPVTYSLAEGDEWDDELFSVSQKGHIRIGSGVYFDYETRPPLKSKGFGYDGRTFRGNYLLMVRATDPGGLSAEMLLALTVKNERMEPNWGRVSSDGTKIRVRMPVWLKSRAGPSEPFSDDSLIPAPSSFDVVVDGTKHGVGSLETFEDQPDRFREFEVGGIDPPIQAGQTVRLRYHPWRGGGAFQFAGTYNRRVRLFNLLADNRSTFQMQLGPPDPLGLQVTRPESHDGASNVTIGLEFDADPAGATPELIGGLVEVQNGTVHETRRVTEGNDREWEVELTPSGTETMEVSIGSSVVDCATEGAVCTEEGGLLQNFFLLQIPYVGDGNSGTERVAATFVDVPASHDGSTNVSFELRFNPVPSDLTDAKVRANLTVTGGTLAGVSRIETGNDARWRVTLTPTAAALGLSVGATTDCEAENAICTAQGAMLAAGASASIPHGTPLTVAYVAGHEPPASHDGESSFTFQFMFSEAPRNFPSARMREHSLRIFQGATRLRPPRSAFRRIPSEGHHINRHWEVEVTPSGGDDITIALGPTSSCDEDGAMCTEDLRPLGNALPATTVRGVPFTVAYVAGYEPPATHDGESPFTFRFSFSEKPRDFNKARMRDHSLRIFQGETRLLPPLPDFRRIKGEGHINRHWQVTVTPSGAGDISIALAATTDCAEAGAVCTVHGTPLSNALPATAVRGPAGLSVADAQAVEGPDATLDFVVTLSRAESGAVTVDYATRDGSATAGSDYTEKSGTLTFAQGETEKTVSVAVLDDAIDEGSEDLRFELSNASGGNVFITRRSATGTIANDDPLQTMWLSRFGRTVADHVTAAVSDRLSAPLAGAQVTVGGQTVNLAEIGDDAWIGRTLTSIARIMGAPSGSGQATGDDGSGPLGSGPGDAGAAPWPGTGLGLGDTPTATSAPARSIAGRELLLGSAFHLAREGDGAGPRLAAWGRATVGGFDGEAPSDSGNVRVDGTVTTGILGTDAEWSRLLAGVAVSVSEGEGTFDLPGVDSGTIESTMTAVSPYARMALSDRVSVWGLAGYGTGGMTIVQKANDATGQPERVSKTDLSMRLAALGGRGALLRADANGGFDLALKADGFFVQTTSEAISQEGDTTAEASRVRLALEGSRAFQVGDGVFTPGLELGLRHDGGDAETGTGVELGGRVTWADRDSGLGMDLNIRALVAHEDSKYREWGASGAVRLAPGKRGRGLSFSLAPTYGAPGSGVGRLWAARDARGLAPGGGTFEPESRLEGELGYGMALFGDRFTGTPNLGFGLSGAGARDYRIGWRLTSAVRGDPGFEVTLDATRREPANDNGAAAPVEHGVTLRAAIRW